jgi:exopolyphosphatase/guanosine-5'-triphosphate,3'-diphosphate pyrophosphatase
MPNNVEIEAKFIIPDKDTFDTLTRLTRLDEFEIKDVGVKTIVDRYLDTPAQQLVQAGYACRIRESNHEKTLTIKSLESIKGEVHRRLELEMEVDGDQPQSWANSEAKSLVLDLVGQTPLNTLFTLYQTRHKYHVFSREQRIMELSLDKVSYHQPTTIDYLGLEAELMDNGTDADLAHLTRILQNKWPLTADPKSKFERALAALKK